MYFYCDVKIKFSLLLVFQFKRIHIFSITNEMEKGFLYAKRFETDKFIAD